MYSVKAGFRDLLIRRASRDRRTAYNRAGYGFVEAPVRLQHSGRLTTSPPGSVLADTMSGSKRSAPDHSLYLLTSLKRGCPILHQRVVTSLTHRPHGARILVVDDSAVMRRALRTLLERQDDWKVCDEASDGREAVAKFDKEKFDVIVLDFQMPGMNGLDAARQITSRSPSTPILMVTLHNSPQLAREAQKAGISGICPKADIACVVEGVTTILDHKSYFRN